MWYLRCSNNSLYYFWEKKNYSVGRKNADIIISNDESISRNHAEIEINPNTVFIIDKGSKYGTFINEVKLGKDEKYQLKENDQLKFGLLNNAQSKFILKKLKFTVVTSNVKSADKIELYNALDFLKADRASAWSKSCTHLVVSEVILTAKVLCALTEEQPIVTAKYFNDYIKTVKKHLLPPNVKDYLPEINESLISKKIKLEYDPSRRTLFNNKIFVFLTEKCKVQMAELISVTGGKAISWEKNNSSIDIHRKDSTQYLFLEENIDDVNRNTDMYKSFSKCVKFLSESGKRSIPLQEIALAIVHNSCEKNCNPLFNRVALLVAENTPSTQKSEEILAFDTEQIAGTSTQKSENEMQTTIVMQSYDDTLSVSQISNNTNNTFKRPLDLDGSDDILPKKSKVEIKVKNINDNNKKHTEMTKCLDGLTANDPFSFERTNSSSQSSNDSNNSVPNFVLQSSTPIRIKENNDVFQKENPFARKRKFDEDIAPPAKKKPLENIGNKKELNKPVILIPQEKLNNDTVKTELSTTTKSTSWLSKSVIKKEFDDNDDVKIKIENDLDDEISKLNEQFRNSIVIEFMPLIVKQEYIVSDFKKQNNSSQVNFKKFKKNNIIAYQTVIITSDQMSRVVIGDTIASIDNALSDNEPEETPEMDMTSSTLASKRKRFQFSS